MQRYRYKHTKGTLDAEPGKPNSHHASAANALAVALLTSLAPGSASLRVNSQA
jgi:hypothetical protein